MEDGLELSLGLSVGGSSFKSKNRSSSSVDARLEEHEKDNKSKDDLRDFLSTGMQNQEAGSGSQKFNPVRPPENFFSNLSKAPVDVEASTNAEGRGFWVGNGDRSVKIEEEKSNHTGNKRRVMSDDVDTQNKHGGGAFHVDISEKNPPIGIKTSTKTSHISITTEDGSTAENEDVAESEVDGSTSRLLLHHDDGVKWYNAGGSALEIQKENHVFSDSNAADLRGHKRLKMPTENEHKHGTVAYGGSYSTQPLNIVNVPYSLPIKDSNSVSSTNPSGYSLPGMIQPILPANGEHPRTQPLNSGNLPLTFGYASLQLPSLDKELSSGLVSHPQQLPSSLIGRVTGVVTPNSDKPNDGAVISQASMQVSSHHAREEGSTSLAESDPKGKNMIFRTKDALDQPTAEAYSEGSAIRPGIAADVRFGGCGSYPNLPWVSTTSPGPNGRTISGVTYRYSRDQIRIVCACHGAHMSPEEFVRHAGEEHADTDDGAGLSSLPSTNPAASAQS
ncbi:Tify domain binding domain [Dillenia turbinata]|uniref:Ninja-family protein n=1 Tax=Dillenia turbinata TaxID=194707 RepID=A0AAN8W4D9_9MAGN